MYGLLEGMGKWNVPLLIFLSAICVLYFMFIKKGNGFRRAQFYLFYMSLCLFYLLIGSPLYVLSHLSFSTHMLQMGILYFIVPPLFLLGIPGRLIHKLKSKALLKRLSISPFIALVIFSILFFLYHLPRILPFLYLHSVIHMSFICFMFVLSMIMWLPVTGHHNSSENNKKRYSWWSGILLMPACLLFIVNGFVHETGASPMLNQLILELCIPAGQMESLLPFQINAKVDQILGGLLMLGLHKISLMLTLRLSFLSGSGEASRGQIAVKMLKPSLRRVE